MKVNSISLAPVPPIDWIKGKHALVLEDPITFSGLAMKLRRLNIPTVFAHTVDKALRLLGDDINNFEVVFIDAQWSTVQDNDLVDNIINLVDDNHLPLIIINSLGKSESYNRKLRFHAVHLFKPFMFHQLRDKLVQVLQRDEKNASLIDDQKDVTLDENEEFSILKILLVEDTNSNQVVTTKILQRLGFDPDTEANGLEALEFLNQENYDVVLMDLQMPKMNGMDVTRRIREDFPPERQPHIIALTASAMRDDYEACLAEGMDNFLPKPIDIANLSVTLDDVSNRYH